ncbi:Hairy/enhancer-of-split with YRPW motif protein 1 [Homalodisca vitripennis]|nr:Hairy/enhancer-of-split with YRPW motif protein 1 [Homalodisca vitripennis]
MNNVHSSKMTCNVHGLQHRREGPRRAVAWETLTAKQESVTWGGGSTRGNPAPQPLSCYRCGVGSYYQSSVDSPLSPLNIESAVPTPDTATCISISCSLYTNNVAVDSEQLISGGGIKAYKNNEQKEVEKGKKTVQTYPKAAWSTVQALSLHSTRLDALAYDPSKFAMDYHNIGFRECAAEVARYLVTVEGLDIQDPLRLRLMSHLQCFAAQRELASKQAPTPWYPGSAPAAQQSYNPLDTSGSSGNSSFETSASCESTPPASTAPPPSSSTLTPLTTVTSGYHQPYHQTTHNHHPYHHNPHNNQNFHQGNSPVSSQMKPYRPWGAEVAY